MGAVLVTNGDEVLLDKGYGMVVLEWNIPNTPDTKFRLGSITKQYFREWLYGSKRLRSVGIGVLVRVPRDRVIGGRVRRRMGTIQDGHSTACLKVPFLRLPAATKRLVELHQGSPDRLPVLG